MAYVTWGREIFPSLKSLSIRDWLCETYFKIAIPVDKGSIKIVENQKIVRVEEGNVLSEFLGYEYLIRLQNFGADCDLLAKKLGPSGKHEVSLILVTSTISEEKLWRIGICLNNMGYERIKIFKE